MNVILIIVIALLMVVIVFLLLSIKANQKFVQSMKQLAQENRARITSLENRNRELSDKLKNRTDFNTDVSSDGDSPEFEELKEKYQSLQTKYEKVSEELEIQQKETKEAKEAAEKAAAAIPPENPDPSAQEKALQEQIERL